MYACPRQTAKEGTCMRDHMLQITAESADQKHGRIRCEACPITSDYSFWRSLRAEAFLVSQKLHLESGHRSGINAITLKGQQNVRHAPACTQDPIADDETSVFVCVCLPVPLPFHYQSITTALCPASAVRRNSKFVIIVHLPSRQRAAG